MIRKTLYLLAQSRNRQWVLVVILAVFGSLLEVVGAALILLLLTLIVDPDTAVALPIIGDLPVVTKDVNEGGTLLVVVAAGIAAFFVVRAVAKMTETYIQQRVVHQAGLRLSAQLVEGYLRMPYVWHLGRHSREKIEELLANSPFIKKAGTLAGLAKEIGVDGSAFLDTVERYNQA